MSNSIIATPTEARVTQRKPLTVRMGRDDAPVSDGLKVRTAINGSAINRAGWCAMTAWSYNEDGTTTGGHVNPAGTAVDTMTGAEADSDDAFAGVYRQRDGGIVRTVDMGDQPLPTNGQVRSRVASYVAASALPVALSPKRPTGPTAGQQRDQAVIAHLRSIGYTGRVTKQIRQLALDALAFADQVKAMGS